MTKGSKKKPRPPMATCTNCEWRGRADKLQPIEHVWERLAPGEPYWDGDCPKCGGVAYRDDTIKYMDNLQRRAHADELPKLLRAARSALRGALDLCQYSADHPKWLTRLDKAVARAKAVIDGERP